jgi:ATP-binding cassette subfamily C protein
MVILRYLSIMWEASPRRSLFFFALLIASSLTEGVGLLLLVPLVSTLQDVQAVPTGVVALIVDGLSFVGIPITLVGLLSAFLALNIVRALVVYCQSIVSEKFRLQILDDLRTKSFDAILESRWDWVTTQKRSDLSNMLITEINRIGGALNMSVRLVVSVISIAVYLAVAFSLSAPMAAIAIGLGGFIFFVMRRQHSIAHNHGQLLGEANRKVQQTVEEGLSGLKLIKVLRSESRHSQLMQDIRANLRDRTFQFVHLNAAMAFIFQIAIASVLVVMLYSGIQVLDLALPTLLILIVIFARLSPQIRQVQAQINAILHAEDVMDRYHALLADAGAANEATLVADAAIPISFSQHIKLSNISYAYETRGTHSFADVSLTIPYRHTTAIMGTSGSGKSTLADLVMGLLTPDSGTIAIDDVVLDEQNRLSWRKSVAYMPQDVFLFHDTIKNNLLWADKTASAEDLAAALRNASADFVFDLPDQLDTIVGDAGQRLSGGEKQRIALARALLQKPQLLILDEATSALDVENEARIRDMIETLHDELTVRVIGHRLPALNNADHLLVLEHGRVKAHGKWDDVAAKL